MNLNKADLAKEIKKNAESLADYATDMLFACGEHKRGGYVTLKIRAKLNKACKLVVDATCTSVHPTGPDTDERFKGLPVPIMALDLDEDQGQERLALEGDQ
jgi:hypothetical protein